MDVLGIGTLRPLAVDQLGETVQKLAEKIGLTPLVTLRLTKIALTRAYEAMGLRNAVNVNLDIAATEVLEETLEAFEGTILVISHDRYFLDRVVDRIVELDEGSLTEYVGGYSDYQAAKAGMT